MQSYSAIQAKLEEYTNMKDRLRNFYCKCYAIYEISVKNENKEFIYVTDYETGDEAADFIDRMGNLTPCNNKTFAVRVVKKNACGEIFY